MPTLENHNFEPVFQTEIEPQYIFNALKENKDRQILANFTPDQQTEIKRKQQLLSSLAYFIGKDFRIPVELNEPGQGWHWDFKANIIRVDPKDLLEKSMDFLRFVISHEGGHRRITRTEFIPAEVWKQPGFSFMMNAIEDPRMNNFVADVYPKFREQMALAYEHDLGFEIEAKNKAKEKLGYQPKFMQAGFEYIRQWFRETQSLDFELTKDLPDDVKEVVNSTLISAQDSWLRYPSKAEADSSEQLISQYAEVSYEINRDKVWPEFKKLVEQDMEDQKMQEMMKESQQNGEEENGALSGESAPGKQGLPQDLKDKLTPEEQKQLEQAIDKAIKDQQEKSKQEQGQAGQPAADSSAGQKPGTVDLDSLSEELKQKIRDYIDSLPDDVKKDLAKKAKAALHKFEKDLNEELEGKLLQNPEATAEAKTEAEAAKPTEDSKAKPEIKKPRREKATKSPEDEAELQKYRDMLEAEVKKDANVYEQYRKEVLPVIDKLEQDLREIFVARKVKGWKSGFKAGKRIDIKRRIQEKAKDVPVMESRAWQKRELPHEKDYAITLLVDLSGSMQGEKIEETFKAVIVLAEVLNRLSINVEILGFNDRIYEYENFGDKISKASREKMGGMLLEVSDSSDTGKARWNDDGWALQQASQRLAKQKADHKFLIVLSDGVPEESRMHPASLYGLSDIISQVTEQTDQKLIGLGIGEGTEHVSEYYPNSLANVRLHEMAAKLADLIEDVIANYANF